MPGCCPGTVLSQFTGFTPFAARLTELRRSYMNKPWWPGKDQTACTPVHKVNSPEIVGPDQQRSFLTHRKHVCVTEMTAAPVDHHVISPCGWIVATSWHGCRRDLRIAAPFARPQGQTGLPRRHTTVVGRSVRAASDNSAACADPLIGFREWTADVCKFARNVTGFHEHPLEAVRSWTACVVRYALCHCHSPRRHGMPAVADT